MPQSVDEPLNSVTRRGTGLLLFGSSIGLMCVTRMVWNEGGGNVVHQVLTARNSAVIVTLGQVLIQLGGCLLGAVIGGTLVSIGVYQAARRNGLSLAYVMLIGLSGVLALCGTFAVCLGAFSLQSALNDTVHSSAQITSEQLTRTTAHWTATLSLGWWLLAVAFGTLVLGSQVQCVTRPKYMTTSTRWPVVTIAALILLSVSGVIASAMWIRSGLAFQQYATSDATRAADVVSQIQAVLFCNVVGSCVLLGYALLITVLAFNAVVTAQSPEAPDSETSSDLSSTLIG